MEVQKIIQKRRRECEEAVNQFNELEELENIVKKYAQITNYDDIDLTWIPPKISLCEHSKIKNNTTPRPPSIEIFDAISWRKVADDDAWGLVVEIMRRIDSLKKGSRYASLDDAETKIFRFCTHFLNSFYHAAGRYRYRKEKKRENNYYDVVPVNIRRFLQHSVLSRLQANELKDNSYLRCMYKLTFKDPYGRADCKNGLEYETDQEWKKVFADYAIPEKIGIQNPEWSFGVAMWDSHIVEF